MIEAVTDADVSALLASGRYLDAARALAQRGERRQAIALYERVWRFADAIPLALELGDRPLAARLCLEARDPVRAAAVAAEIPGADTDDLLAAAAAFASRGHHHEAGRLAERAGDFQRAAASYERAAAWLEAGRAFELAGRWRQAAALYERLLGEPEGATPPSDPERGAARLALGRILGRLGRHREAARAFQAAAATPSVRAAARRELVRSLAALGFPDAATEVLRRLRRDDPSAPAHLAAFMAMAATFPEATRAGAASLHEQGEGLLAGRFRVSRLLGAGATGRVYLADDLWLDRPVAVKVLSVGPGAAGAEREAYARFAREAEAAGRLLHGAIVGVFDVDAAAGLIVMEVMTGGTLAQALEGGDGAGGGAPLSPARARRLGLDLLDALAAAHERGIVHRDVKPANVFFDAAGHAKLGDFGAAHLLDFGQTQTGGFFGTVTYMSPEQISGAPVSAATDLYGLGVTLFEALTGRPPFTGPDLVAQHLGEEPPAASSLRPGLTPEHDATLRRALAKDPRTRFASAFEMAEAVARWPQAALPERAEPSPAAAVSEAPHAVAALAEDVLVGDTGRGVLRRRTDPRTMRGVLVEDLREPLTEADLTALRALAAAGGPHVQRVLAVADDRRGITYEFVEGPVVPWGQVPARDADALAEAERAFRQAGAPADVPRDVVLARGGPVVLVSPRTTA